MKLLNWQKQKTNKQTNTQTNKQTNKKQTENYVKISGEEMVVFCFF